MFSELDSFQLAYWVCAIGGTTIFVVKSLLMAFAGFDDLDLDGGEGAHHGADADFNLISVNSVTGFLMMFGWVGLMGYDQFQLGGALSLLLALLGGLTTMFITAKLFQYVVLLNSPGTRFSIDQTVGKAATVYAAIPAGGKGQIQIVVDDMTRELDATADNAGEIASHTSVTVVRVIDSRTVAVKKS